MKAKIAVLYGLASAGKTSSIKILAGWVKEQCPEIIFENRKLTKETCLILNHKGLRIGIISSGDVLEKVLKGLEWLCKEKCDVVIICCRFRESIRQKVGEKIKELFGIENNEISWIHKQACNDKKNQGLCREQNERSAAALLESVGLRELVGQFVPAY